MADFRSTVYRLVQEDVDLTLPQMAVLMKVAEGKKQDARRFSMLTTTFSRGKSTISRAVTKLAGAGLIVRNVDQGDRRTCWFDLTDAGREMVQFLLRGGRPADETS